MKVIANLFYGAFMGAVAAPGLYAAAFVVEFLACFTPGCNRCADFDNFHGCVFGGFWSWDMFINVLVLLAVAGGVIGAIYGVSLQIKENNRRMRARDAETQRLAAEAAARAKEQREANARDFKKKYSQIVSQCEQNVVEGKKIVLTPSYHSVGCHKDLWGSINEISIPLQDLKDIVAGFNIDKEEVGV